MALTEIPTAGVYDIRLRRWPVELNYPITGGPPDAEQLDITETRLQIRDFDRTKPILDGAEEVRFLPSLSVGAADLTTHFRSPDGATWGAYYVTIGKRN